MKCNTFDSDLFSDNMYHFAVWSLEPPIANEHLQNFGKNFFKLGLKIRFYDNLSLNYQICVGIFAWTVSFFYWYLKSNYYLGETLGDSFTNYIQSRLHVIVSLEMPKNGSVACGAPNANELLQNRWEASNCYTENLSLIFQCQA